MRAWIMRAGASDQTLQLRRAEEKYLPFPLLGKKSKPDRIKKNQTRGCAQSRTGADTDMKYKCYQVVKLVSVSLLPWSYVLNPKMVQLDTTVDVKLGLQDICRFCFKFIQVEIWIQVCSSCKQQEEAGS